MQLLSKEDFLTYLKLNDFHLANSTGMKIMYLNDALFTYFDFYLPGKENFFDFNISTDEDSLDNFIQEFKIHSIEDINTLGYNNSWIRYLNSKAEIGMNIIELEATISFRLYKMKTIVFSLDLHFYDEVNEHLTLAEDFIKYYYNNEKRLQTVALYRYKL